MLAGMPTNTAPKALVEIHYDLLNRRQITEGIELTHLDARLATLTVVSVNVDEVLTLVYCFKIEVVS